MYVEMYQGWSFLVCSEVQTSTRKEGDSYKQVVNTVQCTQAHIAKALDIGASVLAAGPFTAKLEKPSDTGDVVRAIFQTGCAIFSQQRRKPCCLHSVNQVPLLLYQKRSCIAVKIVIAEAEKLNIKYPVNLRGIQT